MADAQVPLAAGKSFSWHRSVCNSVRAHMLDKLPTLLNKLCCNRHGHSGPQTHFVWGGMCFSRNSATKAACDPDSNMSYRVRVRVCVRHGNVRNTVFWQFGANGQSSPTVWPCMQVRQRPQQQKKRCTCTWTRQSRLGNQDSATKTMISGAM